MSEPLRSWLDLAFARCQVDFSSAPKTHIPKADKQANKWKIQTPGSLIWCLNLWVFPSQTVICYNFFYWTEKLPALAFLHYDQSIPLRNVNGPKAFIFFLLCMFSTSLIVPLLFHWSWLIFECLSGSLVTTEHSRPTEMVSVPSTDMNYWSIFSKMCMYCTDLHHLCVFILICSKNSMKTVCKKVI